MVRAQETGSIISDKFPGVPQENCDLLREGKPCIPVYRSWAPDELVRFYYAMLFICSPLFCKQLQIINSPKKLFSSCLVFKPILGRLFIFGSVYKKKTIL